MATLAEAFEVAVQHYNAGRFGHAQTICDRILDQAPDHPDTLHLRGVVALKQRRENEALGYVERAVVGDPGNPAFLLTLGLARKALGRCRDAVAHYQRAVELKRDFAEAYSNMGNAMCALGWYDEAAGACRRALELAPDLEAAKTNLAVALRRGAQEPAQKLSPQELHQRGTEALRQGRLEQAVAAFEAAVKLDRDFADAWSNLGVALQTQGRHDEALTSIQAALRADPKHTGARTNMGVMHMESGRFTDAVASFEQALTIDPNHRDALANLGDALRALGRIDESIAILERRLCAGGDASVHSNLIFSWDASPKNTLQQAQAVRRAWQERFGQPLGRHIQPHGNDRNPDRRLRVGYVSADLRRHSAAVAFSPVLLHHDPRRFEVFCYSCVTRPDDWTARFRAAATLWREVVHVGDEPLAEQIRRDAIDILVDLSGHSAGNRLPVFARKPAPVQVTAWGNATGTGLRAMDYLFTDRVLVPPEEERYLAEKPVHLPVALAFVPLSPDVSVSPLPAATNGYVTFGSLNRWCKISADLLNVWARILREFPGAGAKLLLKDVALDDPAVRQQVADFFGCQGVDPQRLILLGGSPQPQHIAALQRVDIGLDPFPHSGGISTLESLWMGVPTVTLRGSTITGRIGASLLTALDMPDWIAATVEQYVGIAVRAASDLQALAALRTALRGRLERSSLGDHVGYCRAVEAQYRRMWQQWCRG